MIEFASFSSLYGLAATTMNTLIAPIENNRMSASDWLTLTYRYSPR